jgi:zinc/manganese transport system permease protein
MTLHALEISILLPALVAGLLVTATHVPLGMQVLARGIVFIDSAIADRGLRRVAADADQPRALWCKSPRSLGVGGALLLTDGARWPEVGSGDRSCSYCATGASCRWQERPRQRASARPVAGQDPLGAADDLRGRRRVAAILALWFGARERSGPTGLRFVALAVTMSVQLVGLYLVFATLIVPPLATRTMHRGRLLAAWALGALGYAIGLVVSTALDLPTGPVIVWALVLLALAWHLATADRTRSARRVPHGSD